MRGRKRLKELEPWMIQALRKHINEGWSFMSFSGKYWIDSVKLHEWARTNEEVKKIRDDYNASKIHQKRFKHPDCSFHHSKKN